MLNLPLALNATSCENYISPYRLDIVTQWNISIHLDVFDVYDEIQTKKIKWLQRAEDIHRVVFLIETFRCALLKILILTFSLLVPHSLQTAVRNRRWKSQRQQQQQQGMETDTQVSWILIRAEKHTYSSLLY